MLRTKDASIIKRSYANDFRILTHTRRGVLRYNKEENAFNKAVDSRNLHTNSVEKKNYSNVRHDKMRNPFSAGEK